MSGSELKRAYSRLRLAQDNRFALRRYSTDAVVDSVVRDSSGRATAAVCTIDGLSGQVVEVPHGSPVGIKSQLKVTNVGAKTAPVWQAGMLAGGAAGGTPMLITAQSGEPLVTPSGVVTPRANLFRNGAFTMRDKGHNNQPRGWVLSGQVVVSGVIPGEE